MMVRVEREAPRFDVQAPVEYENSQKGSGSTTNLSLVGVLIEYASTIIAIETEIRLRFSFFEGSFDTQFRGTVVRQAKNGFAVHFVAMGEAQLEVLKRTFQL